MMPTFDPKIQTVRVVNMTALQFPNGVGVLHHVEANGTDELCRDGGERLDVVFLFVGAPVAQRLRRCHLLEFLDPFPVFGGNGVAGRAIFTFDSPGRV